MISPSILLYVYYASRLHVGFSRTKNIFLCMVALSELLSYKANRYRRCKNLQHHAVRIIMAHINIIKRTAYSNSLFCLHKYFCGFALTVAHVPTVVMHMESKQYFIMLHQEEKLFNTNNSRSEYFW
jgi:hypothetical protein